MKGMDEEFTRLEQDEEFWSELLSENADSRKARQGEQLSLTGFSRSPTSEPAYTGLSGDPSGSTGDMYPAVSMASSHSFSTNVRKAAPRTPSRSSYGPIDTTRGGRIAKSKTSKGKSPMSHIRTSRAAAQSIREREHRDISPYSTSSPDWAAPNGFSAYEVPFEEGLQYVYRAVYMQARETMGIAEQSRIDFEDLQLDAYIVCLKLIGHMYWLDSTRVSLAVLPASSFQGSRKEQCIYNVW
jgi:hypothetical protein